MIPLGFGEQRILRERKRENESVMRETVPFCEKHIDSIQQKSSLFIKEARKSRHH